MSRALLGLSLGGKLRLALLALLAALVLAPATASAASIVFIKGGNVWLAAADGSDQRQVTTGGDWDSPSQADDGTILAVEGSQLIRMDRQGNELATINTTFTNAPAGWIGPVGATISPDGVNQAYGGDVVGSPVYDPGCGCYDANDHFSTWWGSATHTDQPNQTLGQEGYVSPAWIDNLHLLLSEATIGSDEVATYTLGGGDNSEVGWFSDESPGVGSLNYGTITRAGDKLAFIASLNGGQSYQLRLYQTNGPPPEAAGDPSDLPTNECNLGLNQWEPRRLSFSPDGQSLALGGPQGIMLVDLSGWPSCGGITAPVIISGGTEPYFGPADVGASAGCGACTGSGGGGGGGGGGSTFEGFTVTHRSVHGGVITLTLSAKTAGAFTARGSFTSRAKRGKRTTRSYGSGSARLRHSGVVTLTIKPMSKAARALAQAGRLTVSLTVTFKPAGGSAHVGHLSVTVRRAKKK